MATRGRQWAPGTGPGATAMSVRPWRSYDATLRASTTSRRPQDALRATVSSTPRKPPDRSEEHTSELQSLMRISYAVFCLKKKTQTYQKHKPSSLQTQIITADPK